MSSIAATPSDGLTYNPNEAKYWERAALNKELDRVYDICHGCRLCFNLCPSFPSLFDAVDAVDGDVLALRAEQKQDVVDLCYGCKLCHVKCPYTPEDGHPFKLDFPRLMLRARAVSRKETGGVPLRERVLGNPDLLGKIGTLTPRIANWANKVSFHRTIMQSMLGIHKDKLLPDFAETTFENWFRAQTIAKPAEPAARVALFSTCFVNYNNTAPGRALMEVFAHNNIEVVLPKQNCCGMPAFDGGDIDFAKKQAESNVTALLPLAQAGYKIAAINPTCSLMLRKEYPTLLGTDGARTIAAATVDPHELLFKLKMEGRFNRAFLSTPGSIAYHAPCHLKAQSIGLRSRDLMALIPGIHVSTVDNCCAHDGTWAMKTEYFDLSMKWGKKAFDGISEAEAAVTVTDCPLAAVQIEQATGSKPLHPAEVLARAYRSDGFPTPVTSELS